MGKHYVTFFYPGVFVSETTEQEVKRRDVRPRIPKGAYAYRFYDREEVIRNGETLRGEPKNHSPTVYLGQELSATEAMKTGNATARANIETNGYKRLVRTKHGGLFPLDDGDIVEAP